MARARAGGRLRQGIARIPARAAGAEKAVGAQKFDCLTVENRFGRPPAEHRYGGETSAPPSMSSISSSENPAAFAAARAASSNTATAARRSSPSRASRRRRHFKTVLFPRAASVRDRTSTSRIRGCRRHLNGGELDRRGTTPDATPSFSAVRVTLISEGFLLRACRGGESGTPYPHAAIARKPPKNKDSGKDRSEFVTTAVYHRTGRFGRQTRPISRRLRGGRRTFADVAVRHPVALSKSGMTQQGPTCRRSGHSPPWSARASKTDIRTNNLRGS